MNSDERQIEADEVVERKIRSTVGYDVALCTKRLARLFDDPECAQRCRELVEEAMDGLGIARTDVSVWGDHILIEVRGVPASVSPAAVVNRARSATAPLRSEFAHLASLSSLWNAVALVRSAGRIGAAGAADFRNSLDTRKKMNKPR